MFTCITQVEHDTHPEMMYIPLLVKVAGWASVIMYVPSADCAALVSASNSRTSLRTPDERLHYDPLHFDVLHSSPASIPLDALIRCMEEQLVGCAVELHQ